MRTYGKTPTGRERYKCTGGIYDRIIGIIILKHPHGADAEYMIHDIAGPAGARHHHPSSVKRELADMVKHGVIEKNRDGNFRMKLAIEHTEDGGLALTGEKQVCAACGFMIKAGEFQKEGSELFCSYECAQVGSTNNVEERVLALLKQECQRLSAAEIAHMIKSTVSRVETVLEDLERRGHLESSVDYSQVYWIAGMSIPDSPFLAGLEEIDGSDS